MAVSKLSVAHIIKSYGVIPENTNFGIKVSAVKILLDANGIAYAAPNTIKLNKQEMAAKVSEASIYLTCWKDK